MCKYILLYEFLEFIFLGNLHKGSFDQQNSCLLASPGPKFVDWLNSLHPGLWMSFSGLESLCQIFDAFYNLGTLTFSWNLAEILRIMKNMHEHSSYNSLPEFSALLQCACTHGKSIKRHGECFAVCLRTANTTRRQHMPRQRIYEVCNTENPRRRLCRALKTDARQSKAGNGARTTTETCCGPSWPRCEVCRVPLPPLSCALFAVSPHFTHAPCAVCRAPPRCRVPLLPLPCAPNLVLHVAMA
jgi:hypothetical protein